MVAGLAVGGGSLVPAEWALAVEAHTESRRPDRRRERWVYARLGGSPRAGGFRSGPVAALLWELS